MTNPRTFFDFTIDDEPAGRVIFELFREKAPQTCENFRALCTGEKGMSAVSERPLYYKDSIVHRSIAGFMVQGGDFTKKNGTGGESIYGGVFSDEDLSQPLDAEGLLCMANKGPNTNGSQFFITLRDCPHLNGKHVVFGRVIRGQDIVQRIAEVPVDAKSRPTAPVTIVSCGELQLRNKVAEPPASSLNEGEGRKERKRKHDSLPRSDSRPRSRSRSPDVASKDLKKKKNEKRKRERKSKHAHNKSPNPQEDDAPRKETEEEYDARLEREENERIAARKACELEALKERHVQTQVEEGGVRLKGRGRMRFIDPEMRRDSA